jgi:hypothetical protein
MRERAWNDSPVTIPLRRFAMADDWTKTRVAGATVGVIVLAILGLMCALIWGGIMMAPKNELR